MAVAGKGPVLTRDAPPALTAEAAILIDSVTGTVLYERYAHVRKYPASTTKTMTGLLCVEKGDSGTKELLEAILKDEEDHVDDLEAKQDQIAQMDLPHFLMVIGCVFGVSLLAMILIYRSRLQKGGSGIKLMDDNKERGKE